MNMVEYIHSNILTILTVYIIFSEKSFLNKKYIFILVIYVKTLELA